MDSGISLKRIFTFALAFSLVGGYFIWHSFAAPNPNLSGDVNNDNVVDSADLTVLKNHYATTDTTADLNSDGQTNILDLSILLAHFNQTYTAPSMGPLRVLASNPRYFTNDGVHAVYLTGSHNWANLIDFSYTDPPAAFNYDSYVNLMTSHGMNFMRLWASDMTVDKCGSNPNEYWSPLPWARTGPGNATDGHLKFDLNQFNQAYFDRLRARVIQARDSGIYVSVMLFDGYATQFCRTTPDGMPFNSANNINGINLATPTDFLSLNNSAVTAIQDAYVRKVIDTVNDLDNVLYEASNESGPNSTAWQAHIISLVKSYESGKPKQHPVGMTFQYSGGSNSTLFASNADWISPNSSAASPYSYSSNPPPADGSKVILSDTDHLCGECLDSAWVWKAFMRGDNPIYMDSLVTDATKEGARVAMGRTLAVSKWVNLAPMIPSTTISNTGYALVETGSQYLAYTPTGGSFTVDLSGTSGTFTAEWYNPGDGSKTSAADVTGGAVRTVTPPFSGVALIYLHK